MDMEAMWEWAGKRIEEHLRSCHNRGIYLEMERAFWDMYFGRPLRVTCPECGFTITVEEDDHGAKDLNT